MSGDAITYYRELLQLHAEGRGPTAIAEPLDRSASTIRDQIQNFRNKGIIRDDKTLDEEKFDEWLSSPGGISAIRQSEKAMPEKSGVGGEQPAQAAEREADVSHNRLTEGEVADLRAAI